MARAAKAAPAAARQDGGATPASPSAFARRAFSVWHREQMVSVPAGPVLDAALTRTLRDLGDDPLVEWRP